MKTLIVAGAAIVGGVIASRSLSKVSRRRLTGAVARRMLPRMEQMIASLPEGRRRN